MELHIVLSLSLSAILLTIFILVSRRDGFKARPCFLFAFVHRLGKEGDFGKTKEKHI